MIIASMVAKDRAPISGRPSGSYMPEAVEAVAQYEEAFGVTIQRSRSIREAAAKGIPYRCDRRMLQVATSAVYQEPIRLPPGAWRLPPGAFAEAAGPT